MKDFQRRIKRKDIAIAIVGLGYVGLPLAVRFAKNGLKVVGIDIDKERISRLKRKDSYITDVSNKELKEVLASSQFSVSGDFAALKKVDCIIICVPTPLKRKYYPDISYIKQAVKLTSKNIKKGSLVILESTTYPGTTEEIILPLFKEEGLVHNKDFYLCFSPERIDPGNKRYPLSKIPKIVAGISRQARDLAILAYQHIIDKIIPVSSTRAAEAVKLLENTFRLINIGLINELAMMAHRMNINIWEVIDAASTKPFGFMPFYPGPGVGGHCIGKDPLYLYWKAKHFGFRSRFIKLASDIISSMPEYVALRLEDALRQKNIRLKGARILIVGVTYKKDIKDLRQSPSLDIIYSLQNKKAKVSYFDPLVPHLKSNYLNLRSTALKKDRLKEFDSVVIAVDHSCLDYAFILKNSKLIFDARNVYKNNKDGKIIRL